MKKRVLATILTVCLLFSVMACVASAEADIIVGEIISSKRICPGDVISFSFIPRPEIEGGVYAEGWEIKYYGGEWVPYTGEPISEYAGVFSLRYFAADADGNYARSNECVVTVAHNPSGPYEYSGTEHWRVCEDCGGQVDKGSHTHIGSTAAASSKVCEVCGNVRTSQWTGLLAFIEWIGALLDTLLNKK